MYQYTILKHREPVTKRKEWYYREIAKVESISSKATLEDIRAYIGARYSNKNSVLVLTKKEKKRKELVGMVWHKFGRKYPDIPIIMSLETYVAPKFRGNKIGMLMKRHLLYKHMHGGYEMIASFAPSPEMKRKIEALNWNPPKFVLGVQGKRVEMPVLIEPPKLPFISNLDRIIRINPAFLKATSREMIASIIRKELEELEKRK